LADLAAGRAAGSLVAIAGLSRLERSRLKAALRHLSRLPAMVQDVLTR
jgi:hypothetical protein